METPERNAILNRLHYLGYLSENEVFLPAHSLLQEIEEEMENEAEIPEGSTPLSSGNPPPPPDISLSRSLNL